MPANSTNITCNLQEVLPKEMLKRDQLFIISSTNQEFVFEFKAWVKILFGIDKHVNVHIGSKCVADFDSIGILRGVNTVVRFCFTSFIIDPATILKNLKSASFYVPPAIKDEVKLLAARVSGKFLKVTESESTSAEKTSDEELDGDALTTIAAQKVSPQVNFMKSEVQTPEVDTGASLCGDATTNDNCSAGESCEKLRKRKRVRKHKSRKKEETEQFQYQFTLPVPLQFQTSASKAKHIHFDNDPEELVDVNVIPSNPDKNKEKQIKCVDTPEVNGIQEQNKEETFNGAALQKGFTANRKRRAGGNKTFSIGSFLTQLRMENEESKSEETPLTNGDFSFDQPEKKKRVRCRKPRNVLENSTEQVVDESSGDKSLEAQDCETLPLDKGELSPAQDLDTSNIPASAPCSTPNFELDPDTSLQQLFSLRKTYGSPPVFIRNLEGVAGTATV